jgi:hypothetical protein
MGPPKHKPESEVTIEDVKDAISVLNDTMADNTSATVQTGKDVADLKTEVVTLKIELKATREQMTSNQTFLQSCVEKVINGKSAAEVETSKALRTKVVHKAKSDATVQKMKVEARNKLIERLVSWGLTIAAVGFIGAEKLHLLPGI